VVDLNKLAVFEGLEEELFLGILIIPQNDLINLILCELLVLDAVVCGFLPDEGELVGVLLEIFEQKLLVLEDGFEEILDSVKKSCALVQRQVICI